MSDDLILTEKSRPADSLKSLYVLLGLGAVVIFFSTAVFMGQSLGIDEGRSLWQASYDMASIVRLSVSSGQMPLYLIFLHVWRTIFGNSLIAARILSLIFYLASIPALYLLGKRTLGRRAGVFGAMLLALSPFLSWYANEASMFSLALLVTILNQLFFLELCDRFTKARSWGYETTALLGILTQPAFIFGLCAQWVFLFVSRHDCSLESRRIYQRIGITSTGFILLWAIAYAVINGGVVQQSVAGGTDSYGIVREFSSFIFGFQDAHISTLLVSLWPITVLFGFLALRQNRMPNAAVIYYIFAVIIPIALAVSASAFLNTSLVGQYVILSVPALYLFLSWVLETYPLILATFLRALLVCAMLIGLIAEAGATSASPVKEDYQSAATYLQTSAASSDVIAVTNPEAIYPIEFYYQGSASLTTIPLWQWDKTSRSPSFNESQLSTQIQALAKNHTQIWLVFTRRIGYEDQIKQYFDTHYAKFADKQFSQNVWVYGYQVKY